MTLTTSTTLHRADRVEITQKEIPSDHPEGNFISTQITVFDVDGGSHSFSIYGEHGSDPKPVPLDWR